jgi:predicted CXXCH cytochrome family protein
MKKTTGALLVGALGLLLASPAVAGVAPGTGVVASSHDLSANGAYTSGDALNRVCIYCHAPHNTYKLSKANGGPANASIGGGPQASDAFDYLPLWNHTLQANTAYSMYYAGPGAPSDPANPRAQQTLGKQVPGSVSLLCLSCHDGSVAVNSYGNSSQPINSQGPATKFINSGYVIGKDQYLGNHHPIGFDYDAVAAVDTNIVTSAGAAFGGSAGVVKDHLFSSAVTGSTRTMECATCHSVHNKDNSGESFLWKSDAGSALCLTCHKK